MKKPQRKQILLGLLAGFAVALVVLRIALPGLVVNTVNAKLPEQLTADGRLGELDLGLLAGRAEARNLRIGQPPGFGDGALLDLGAVRAKVSLGSLFTDRIEVSEVSVERLAVHLVKDTNGVLNVQALIPAPKDGGDTGGGADAPATPEDASPGKQLLLRSLSAEHLVLRYTDLTFGEPPLDLVLTNLQCSASDLLIAPEPVSRGGPGELRPGTLVLKSEILQPAGGPANLGLAAQLGTLGAGIPQLRAGLRLTGLELVTVKPALVPGAREALGGSALDLSADLALGPELLDCLARLVTDQGNDYDIVLKGTPDAPKLDAGALTGSLLKRPGKFVTKALGNAGQTAGKLAEGIKDTGTELVKGAGKTAKGLGGGLLNAARNLAKGELGKAGKDLADTATRAGSDVANTVKDSAGKATAGAVEAGSTAIGQDDAKAWRTDVPLRFVRDFAEAEARIKQLPWPPAASE